MKRYAKSNLHVSRVSEALSLWVSQSAPSIQVLCTHWIEGIREGKNTVDPFSNAHCVFNTWGLYNANRNCVLFTWPAVQIVMSLRMLNEQWANLFEVYLCDLTEIWLCICLYVCECTCVCFQSCESSVRDVNENRERERERETNLLLRLSPIEISLD